MVDVHRVQQKTLSDLQRLADQQQNNQTRSGYVHDLRLMLFKGNNLFQICKPTFVSAFRDGFSSIPTVVAVLWLRGRPAFQLCK